MDTNEAVAKAEQYLGIIGSIVHVQSAYLFGSHAGGAPREDSDIDVGLFTESMPSDYLGTLKLLFRARRDVDPRIEPHLFVTGHDASGFQTEVISHGVRLKCSVPD